MGRVEVSAKLTGVEQVLRRFSNLNRKAASSIARKATRAGLGPMRAAVRATSRFNNRTGNLRRSFRTSVMRSKRDRNAILGRVLAGKRGTGVAYATPLEYGHRVAVDRATGASAKNVAFFTTPTGKARKMRTEKRRAVSGGDVAPRWYMRSAFSESTSAAKAKFTERFVAEVEAEAKHG